MNNKFRQEGYKIAYAVFRTADTIRDSGIKLKIQRNTLSFLEGVFSEDFDLVRQKAEIIRALIEFGNDLGYISYGNREILGKYIDSFKNKIRAGGVVDFNIGEFLEGENKEEAVSEEFRFNEEKEEDVWNYQDSEKEVDDSVDSSSANIRQDSSESNEMTNSANLSSEIVSSEGFKDKMNTSVRRKAVGDKIKKEGMCFLKDLTESFPNYSERTIRYDLEKLVSEGLIEKIGSSGPGTFYSSKNLEVKSDK